jgi:hypothetical protein
MKKYAVGFRSSFLFCIFYTLIVFVVIVSYVPKDRRREAQSCIYVCHEAENIKGTKSCIELFLKACGIRCKPEYIYFRTFRPILNLQIRQNL